MLLGSYAPSIVAFRGSLIRELICLGHVVEAVAPDLDARARSEIEAIGAHARHLPMQRTGSAALSDILYLFRLRQLMRKSKPDLVLTYTIKPNIWGSYAATSCGINSVAMVTGLGYAFSDSASSPWGSLVKSLARQLYRGATRRNTRVIFQNVDDRGDFIAAGCLDDPSKAALVHGSGVDLTIYKPTNLPARPMTFLMIARLLRAKGVREFVEAARQVRERYPAVRFRLAGWLEKSPDSIQWKELQSWIDEGAVEFLGKLDDVRPAIASATVYVLPSYREGTPRTVLEAMAMGRPIITTSSPGCRETVEHGVNGLLVPPRDADALARSIMNMIERPDYEIQSMANASLKIASKKYDVHFVNRQMLEIMGL